MSSLSTSPTRRPSRHFPFTASACLTAATNEGFESEAGSKKRGRNLESTPDRVAQFYTGPHFELKLTLGRTMSVSTEPASNTSISSSVIVRNRILSIHLQYRYLHVVPDCPSWPPVGEQVGRKIWTILPIFYYSSVVLRGWL